MEKFRVQFNNEIIGPYTKNELRELVKKGYFPRFVKVSPLSDPENKWFNLVDVPGLDDIAEESQRDSSLLHKIKKIPKEKPKSTYKKQLKRKKDTISKNEISTKRKPSIDDDVNPEKGLDLKSTLISKNTYQYLEGVKKGFEDNLNKTFDELEKEKDANKTQFYDLEEFKGALKEADETEDELIAEEKSKKDETTSIVNANPLKDNTSRRLIYLVVIALIAIIFTLDEEESSSKKSSGKIFIAPKFSVPLMAEGGNTDKALSIFDGTRNLDNFSYPSLLKRTQICLNALEQGESNDILQSLLKTYVLMLPFSVNPQKDGAKIYKMFGLLKNDKNLKDPGIVSLKTRFYLNVNKPETSVYHLENYFKLNNKLSSLILATYLESLVKMGDLEKAKKAINKIYELQEKGVYSYIALLEYLKVENKFDTYGALFTEAYGKFPKSIQILLYGINYYIIIKDYPRAKNLLAKIKELDYENHRIYYAQYLESMGVIEALDKNYDTARRYFEKAIQINPESEIVARLASLENDISYSEINQLINKSKSINFMVLARKNYKSKKWNKALSYALKAVDSYPEYIPAKILLAEIQIHQGYLKEAIKLLEKSSGKTIVGLKAKIMLLKAYSASYKFKEGAVLISELNQTEVNESDDYTEVVAFYYEKKEDYLRTILWLQKTLKLNPLNESALYKLAKLYLDNNQFDRSKKLISSAMELNPSNVDFKLLYANILYELEDVETAVGFLRSLLKEFPGNLKIENQIAIYYYRSGQINDFEKLLASIKDKKKQDASIYLFLMKAAQIEQKYGQVINNAEEYLLLNNHDHEVRLTLANTYFDLGKFDEAKSVLQEIEEKVDSYPRLYYTLSKIALIESEKDKAINYAQKEIDHNPFSPYGYIQMGNIHRDDDEFTKAEGYYKKAQRLDPNDMELLKGLAIVKFKKNQHEAALDLYKKIRDSSSEVEPEIHFYIGEVYRSLGRTKLALESYKTYLELYPESPIRSKIETYIESLK